MRKVFFYSLIVIFFLTQSCGLSDEITEPKQNGISFEIINGTNLEYENAKVIIGGINSDKNFVEIDSYTLPTITKGLLFIHDGFDDKRWKPNFDEIKKIGDGKAFFKFQFDNKPANFIEYVNNPDLNLYIDLTRFEVSDNFGLLIIDIEQNEKFDKNGDLVFGNNHAMGLSQRKDL